MKRQKILITLFLTVILLFTVSGCGKKEEESYRVIKVEKLSGSVVVDRQSKNETIDAFVDMNLISGDVINVELGSSLYLLVDSEKHMRAGEDTKFEIEASGTDKKGSVKINLLKGEGVFSIDEKLNSDSTFEVTTPNAVMSVRGTVFSVSYDKYSDTTSVIVSEGIVYTQYNNGEDSIEIHEGGAYCIKGNELMPLDGEITFPEAVDTSNAQTGELAAGEQPWQNTVENNKTEIDNMYKTIVQNMVPYLASIGIDKQYDFYDYLYFDYDHDGDEEVILYLRFKADAEFYEDLVFLNYNTNTEKVEPIDGVYHLGASETCYECKGDFMIHSWDIENDKSEIYVLDSTNGVSFNLIKEYDYVFTDFEKEGMYGFVLYYHDPETNGTDLTPFSESGTN